MQLIEHLKTIGAGHSNITDDGIGLTLLDFCQQAIGLFETAILNACLIECAFEHPADGIVVVDHPDVCNFSHH